MIKILTSHQKEMLASAKAGERFVIVSQDVNGKFKFVESLGKIYQSADKYVTEAIALAKQEGCVDELFVGEINVYLEQRGWIALQSIQELSIKRDIADAVRWHQKEGFDYCLLEDRNIVLDSMTGLPIYMNEEKAHEWMQKGYVAVKVSRYLANGKPIIMGVLR